jgi:hypothetical protein
MIILSKPDDIRDTFRKGIAGSLYYVTQMLALRTYLAKIGALRAAVQNVIHGATSNTEKLLCEQPLAYDGLLRRADQALVESLVFDAEMVGIQAHGVENGGL